MNDTEFKQFASFLQDTLAIANNLELRRKAYFEFSNVYEYLESNTWAEENLIERHEPSDNAIFQNIAEGYYRLGFIEKVFFEYSRLSYELWYQKAVEFQNSAQKRIHKGTQVHQIAEIYLAQNKTGKAWEYFLAGFTEDVIEGRDYVESQAYRALRTQNLSHDNLKEYATKIKELKGNDTYNPLQVVEQAEKETIIPSYEENEIVDNLKLNKAKELWEELLKAEEVEQNAAK